MRMADRRVKAQFERGNSFEIEIDGERIIAYEGETIAAALLAAGRRSFRYTIQKLSKLICFYDLLIQGI